MNIHPSFVLLLLHLVLLRLSPITSVISMYSHSLSSYSLSLFLLLFFVLFAVCSTHSSDHSTILSVVLSMISTIPHKIYASLLTSLLHISTSCFSSLFVSLATTFDRCASCNSMVGYVCTHSRLIEVFPILRAFIR